MNHPYSEGWDKKLRKLMSEYKFTECDGFIAKLGDYRIWVSNYPYAAFRPISDRALAIPYGARPSRETIEMAKKKLDYDMFA